MASRLNMRLGTGNTREDFIYNIRYIKSVKKNVIEILKYIIILHKVKNKQ